MGTGTQYSCVTDTYSYQLLLPVLLVSKNTYSITALVAYIRMPLNTEFNDMKHCQN